MVEVNLVLEGEDAKQFNYIMRVRGFKSKAECVKTLIREWHEQINV